MRTIILAFAAVALLIAATPQSNQAIDDSALAANASGNFTLKATPPADGKLVDWSHFQTYVNWATPSACSRTTAQPGMVMDWNAVVSCAAGHSASQQTETLSGNYHTITYTATFNSHTGIYFCNGPFGSDGYTGSPITLPAGTVAPSVSTPLALSLSGVSFPGSSTSLTVQLKNPAGSVVQTWSGISTSTFSSGNYTTAGAAGAWSWTITQIGGSDGACDPTNGVTNQGGAQAVWNAQATWYQ